MAMDIAAMMKPGAAPDPDAATEETESSPLVDALEQMRALCDQIEAEQMTGRKSALDAPPAAEEGESGGVC